MGRKTNDTSSISEVWIAFWESEGHSVPHFQALCEHYMFLVDIVANKIMQRHIPFEFGEIRSMGFIGLCNAVRAYNPLIGAKFCTFAPHRIRGEILDTLRTCSGKFAPRLNVSRTKIVSRIRDDFFKQHGRNPVAAEIEAVLRSHNTSRIDLIMSDCDRGTLQSLDSGIFETDSGKTVSVLDQIRDEKVKNPQNVDAAELIRSLCAGVFDEHVTITIDYFVSGLTMKELGEKYRFSECRISQIVGSVVDIMKSRKHLLT